MNDLTALWPLGQSFGMYRQRTVSSLECVDLADDQLPPPQELSVICDTSWEMDTNIYSSQIRNQWQTKTQLGEPILLIGATYRNMGEGWLTGSETTQRQLHRQKPIPAWVTAQESRNPEAAQPAVSLTGWTVSLGSSFGLSLFWAAWLVPESSKRFGWSQPLLGSIACLRVSLSGS